MGETQSAWHPTRYEPCVIFYKLITALVVVRMRVEEQYTSKKNIFKTLAKPSGENRGDISTYQALVSV